MAKVRVGIIGCGSRGKGHIRILHGFEDVDLVAVCDPVAEALEAVSTEYGIQKGYEDVNTFLDREELEAIIVASPAHLNAELALPCLEQGVPTLIEKPPGLSTTETERLKAAAAKTGAKAMVGWNRRFNPIITQAHELILQRGAITQLVGEFHKNILELLNSGKFADVLLDRMLFEFAIHSIDIVRYLAAADVAEVNSYVRRSISDFRDVHAALVVFENGTVAQFIHNFTAAARLERYEIHGHEISAYLEGITHGQVLSSGKKIELSGGSTGGTEEQDRFFIDCVKDDTPIALPAANLDEAIKTMELAEAILAGTR